MLVNLQLYNGDMNPINESYRTYSVSWKQARETFDSYGMDGWEDANLDNDVKLEMSSEILAENIWEFIEDVRSELNLQNMKIAMPKDLPVLDSNNEWAIVFGKFLHKEIFDIIENIELVDISTEELYEE